MVIPIKHHAHRWGTNFDRMYRNRAHELRAAWWRLSDDFHEFKEVFKKPWWFELSTLKRRASMDYDEYDTDWRISVDRLYKCTSQGDESAFKDAYSDAASDSVESYLGMARSPSPCLPAVEALDDPSLNLCHRCAGINAESLSGEFGYEHGLLSELPSLDQLNRFMDWPNCGPTELCKLCVVFVEAFRGSKLCSHISVPSGDRYRLVLDLEGVEKETTQEKDHFNAFHVLSGQKTLTKTKSISSLVLRIMDLDLVEQLEEYTGPRGSYPEGTLMESNRKFSCFTDENDPNIQFGVTPVRTVGDSTSSAASFEVAAAWLSECLAADPSETTSLSLKKAEPSSWDEDVRRLRFENVSGWPEVSHSPGPERPTRLLEIGSGLEGDIVHLIENDEDEVPYATLSYCWGIKESNKQSQWLTTTKNVHSRRAGFQRSDLPQTLQDSITVSKKLGIQHLWIDALCIIQDSEDDWTVEAAKMGGIYRGSLVTIVAAASSSAEHGFFNQRSISTMEVLRAHEKLISIQSSLSDGRTSTLHIIIGNARGKDRYSSGTTGQDLEIEDLYRCQVKKGHWFQRAWTLQEHVLSRRVLFYTSQMLLWECEHCRLSEDRFPQMQGDKLYPLELVGSGAWRGPDSALTLKKWYCGLAEQYSRRQMTFEGDKMVAIGALAKATSRGRQIPYLAGLWGDSVCSGLMWSPDGPGSKSKAATCPSWSWASQSSPITYILADRQRPSNEFMPQLLDVHVEAADIRNPFGDVKSGYVMLHTKLQTARVLRDYLGQSPNHSYWPFCHREVRGLFIDSETVMSQWPVAAYMDDEDNVTHEVLVALVGNYYSFVALLLTSPKLDAEEYWRVGIAILEYNVWGIKEPVDREIMRWTTRTIKIV